MLMVAHAPTPNGAGPSSPKTFSIIEGGKRAQAKESLRLNGFLGREWTGTVFSSPSPGNGRNENALWSRSDPRLDHRAKKR